MNKAELIDTIAAKTKLTKKDCGSVLDAAVEAIIESVANGDRVTLVGFGSFEAKGRGERLGRNPQTGESITIAATTVPVFTAGKDFKGVVKDIRKAQ